MHMDKQAIRETVWSTLEARELARFPFPPHGRIPNFEGAREAAERVTTLDWWDETTVIKANPDAPQRFVRERALLAGKTVVMAVPRLAAERPFLVIDPTELADPRAAASISGATEYGKPTAAAAVPSIDAIVSGSVAVDRSGRRIGKGEGYGDLEFAILVELDRTTVDIPITTTVHDVQVFEESLPMDDHDVALDYIVTPSTILMAEHRPDRPRGIDREAVSPDRCREIPVLDRIVNTS